MNDLFSQNRASGFQSLDEVFQALYAMTDDPLADAGTNVVIHRGNPEARILLVGEAPGPQENIKGKPFVGPAGQLLDKILLAVNLDPERDVFIINSVFRMPPGENGRAFRAPTSQEVAWYRPYVFAVMRLMDPWIVLLTGNVACESVLGRRGITRLRGRWQQIDGRWVMPLFHPSYLLRNPARTPGSPKALMWDDIRAVRRKYDEMRQQRGMSGG